MRSWVAVLLLIGAVLSGANASANTGKRVALVVGNGAYVHAPALGNPTNDAADIAQALRDIGFQVVERRDADQRAMTDAIREFSRLLRGAEVALFYYAGHAFQVAGNNYLLPVDVRIEGPSDVKLRMLDLSAVMEEMETERRANLIFLDACRDNPFANALAWGTRSIATRGLALPQTSGIGSLIAFATQPNNVAWDGTGRNSPFTSALLKYIKTPGLEIRTMLSHVRNEVIEATGEKQVPWENSSLRGNVYLRPPVEAAGADKPDEELLYWQSVERIGTKAAFEAYKDRFGDNGRFSRLANERIAALTAPAPQPNGPSVEGSRALPATPAETPSRPPTAKKGTVANVEPDKPEKTPKPRLTPPAPARAKQVEPRRETARPKRTAQRAEAPAPRSAPRPARTNAGSCFIFRGTRVCE